VAAPPYDEHRAIELAARQLMSAQLDSGLFEFDMDFVKGRDSGVHADAAWNVAILYVAREAAALHGLAKYYAYAKDESAGRVVAKAIGALGDASLPIAKPMLLGWGERIGLLDLPFLRVSSRNALTGLGLLYSTQGNGRLLAPRRDYATIWAGATALALMGELYFAEAGGGGRFQRLRQQWRDGLLTLHVAGRGFRQLADGIDEHPYANGEAWLALALYARVDPAEAPELAALDDYMMRHYEAAPRIEFFHWGMMSAAQRFAVTRDARLVTFARSQARRFLDAKDEFPGDNNCAFVEGLAAAQNLLRRGGAAPDDVLASEIHARIEFEMRKNLALQIQPDQDRIDLGAAGVLLSPHLARFAGAFLAGKDTPLARIDLTEHCLSALVEMAKEAPGP
jgi:hypothetical protein